MTMQTPVLQERPALDLRYTAFDHRVRDLRVIGTWFLGDGEDRPCLAIVPAKISLPKATPYIVQLDNLHLWAEETCDEVDVVGMACDACVVLGKNPGENADILQVVSTIRERLYDLYKMPPAPPREKYLVGDVTMRLSDGRVIQKEVKDDV